MEFKNKKIGGFTTVIAHLYKLYICLLPWINGVQNT